jgi:hypothetical protein
MGFQHLLHKSPCLDMNHAEWTAIAGKVWNPCWEQDPSGSYKGLCWALFNDKKCFAACKNDNTRYTNGYCEDFKCLWEYELCTSETEAIASTLIKIQEFYSDPQLMNIDDPILPSSCHLIIIK